jgi:hypothetical protein
MRLWMRMQSAHEFVRLVPDTPNVAAGAAAFPAARDVRGNGRKAKLKEHF